MAQIAGFRGALWDSSKVDLAKVAAQPVRGVKDKLEKGELVRDGARAMYLYEQTFQHQGRPVTRKTVLAAVKLVPWSDGVMRAHEAVDDGARELAVKGVAIEGAHTEPLFVGYRDAAREVDRLFRKTEDGKPALDTTTPDGTRHRVWREPSAEIMGKLRPLFAPKKLHVLDGNARYEGMLAYSEQQQAKAATPYSTANYALACLVNLEDPALIPTARHLIVRGKDVARDTVLDKAKAWFLVEKLAGAAGDSSKHAAALADSVAHQPAFLVVFGGDPDAYKLTLKPDTTPTGEGVQVHRALQKYDPIVIQQLFVPRAVPAATWKTTLHAATVHKALEGGAELGVIARPLTLEQIVHVDELGQLLPFGSTGFLPTLARMLVYVIDPEEDVV